jgi:hypothetical protein
MKVIKPFAAPTGLQAQVVNTANNVAASIQSCVPTYIQAIQVSWSSTALGITFDHYEIQRQRVGTTDWFTIAAITPEGDTSFTDFETARGAAYQYRIRASRTDGVDSLWSAATPGVTAQAVGCEMIFVSNEQPDLGCAFDYGQTTDYDFLAASRDQIIGIYGSNFQVAFMEAEDPGLQFPATITVNFGVQSAVDTVAIFGPIRTIARAPASYICVLDYLGNAYMAHLQVGAGHVVEPGHVYTCDVIVTEVTNTPSVAAG